MGKERNPKKGNREDEGDDEVGSVRSRTSDDVPMKGKKKGRDEDEDLSKKIDGKDGKEGGKKKREKKKGKGASAKDSDENEDVTIQKVDLEEEGSRKDPEKKKTNKKKQKPRAVSDDDDDDILISKSVSKKSEETTVSKKVQKPKSVFELLADEGMDVDMDSDNDDNKESGNEEKENPAVTVEVESKKEEKGKKGKKEKKKKEEDEELERMLAEIELGEKKKNKPKQKEVFEEVEEKGVTIVTEIPDDEDEKPKRKKKKKKEEAEQKETKPDDAEKDAVKEEGEGEEEEGGTVKSAAQKKKEKKERDRQKKLAQKPQAKKTDDTPTVTEKEVKISEELAAEPAKVTDDAEKAKVEADEDDDGKKKKVDKKKTKKDKDKDEKKEDKKRPGKKQILAMQEALKKLKEEEERQRLEEEAKLKAAEEAEALRLEKLRLEQERKEKRKQKEKEKRERLRAEGKLLTQTQKQQRARAQAMLEALRAQGIDVPQIGEKKERTPRPGDRIRNRKPKPSSTENQSKETTPEQTSETAVPSTPKENDKPLVITEETSAKDSTPETTEVKDTWEDESDADVKDNWEVSSSEEDEEDSKSDVKKPVSKASPKKSANVRLSVDDKSEESESESEGSSKDSDEESSSEESDSEDDDEDDQKPLSEKIRERALLRIQKRREDNEKNRSLDKLRSPVVCVLGHVDTGKTKILDKIRHTHVQDSEAGGITQQIGATMVPMDVIHEQSKMVKNFATFETKIPGLLIIDTPGHESFSNLRSRGSSLCDIAILVVDIMHGLEPQTIESINLLKQKKTPFVVALNKIDRLYEWKPNKHKDVQDTLKSQNRNTQLEFEERVKSVIVQFAEQSLNAKLFYENKDPRTFISLVPTSAHSGDGMGNLMALIVELTQTMMAKRITFTEELQATVLEVKAIPGLGTTIDVILVNGRLKEGETMVLAGVDGPLVTQIRSLLMPQPLKELRVKNPYQEFKAVEGAQGIKVTGKDLEKAIAGLNLLIAHHPDEVEVCKEEVAKELQQAMSSIKLAERGVFVQASTLGSLEALLEFLRTSKIPYSGIRIGPVVKKDVMKASIMLEHDSQYAVILAFDVKIERDAQDLADNLGVKIFAADIIYHLFDKFMAYREELKAKKRDQFKHVAVFPCKLRILPQFIFNSRDPIVVGVSVEAGVVKEGTPLCVPSRDFLDIGTVTTIELNHKSLECARKGQEVCIKIEPISGETPKLYGRHFEHTDHLVSKISRQSIDACKEYFRDDLQKTDWQLMLELKKIFQIV